MKIIGINSSPRREKSQTLQLVRAALKGAEASGADVEYVDICQLDIGYCIGCGVCYAKGVCYLKDDFPPLLIKILDSDGIVLGSPNYFCSVTAQLKTLVDRMADAVHCQLLVGKYGCSVAVSGGPEHHEATDYMGRLLMGFGADVVGASGASIAVDGDVERATAAAEALGRDLVEAIRTKRAYPKQEVIHKQMRSRFSQLVSHNREGWPHEYDYWKSLGEI